MVEDLQCLYLKMVLGNRMDSSSCLSKRMLMMTDQLRIMKDDAAYNELNMSFSLFFERRPVGRGPAWSNYTHMYVFLCTYIHTYIRTYVRTYIHTYIHTYIQILCMIKGIYNRTRHNMMSWNDDGI